MSNQTEKSNTDVPIVCPNCHNEVGGIEGTNIQKQCLCNSTSIIDGVVRFGQGYSSEVTEDRVTEVATDNDKILRADLERRLADYSESVIQEYSPNNKRGRFLSLGCGAGYDVVEYLKRGWASYGIETVDLAKEWRQFHKGNAPHCIVSTNGDLPFPDDSFDLAFSYVVMEHVGTIPPKECTTKDTHSHRYIYIKNAVSKLRKNGVLFLITPNKSIPIDPHHGHYYIPFSNWFRHRIGFTPTIPFSKKNFIPSPAELENICKKVATEYKIEYTLITDPHWLFFGINYPNWIGSIYSTFFKVAPKTWRKYLTSFNYLVIRKKQ